MECEKKTDRCVTCHSHFQMLRPQIKEVFVTKRFKRDLPNFNVDIILNCDHIHFHSLHKFEKAIEGNHIFRALKKRIHILYCIDKNHCCIFMRAFKNFTEYEKFLNNNKKIMRIISSPDVHAHPSEGME